VKSKREMARKQEKGKNIMMEIVATNIFASLLADWSPTATLTVSI